jgi:hypothetical protein
MASKIQLRRGTAAEWTQANPILSQGEMGVETDTGKFKIGNNLNVWSTLSYVSVQGVQGIQGIQSTQGNQGIQGTAGSINTVTIPGPYTSEDAGSNGVAVGQMYYQSNGAVFVRLL